MQKSIFFICIISFLSFSCKKEKTTWDSNWSAPLVHGSLTLDDLIPSEYTSTNSDNYLSIVFNESVYSFSIDTLIDLPDTTIIKKTAVALPSISVNPGFVYGDVYDQVYELGDIELKRVIVKSGEVEMTIRSPWPGNTKLTFDFPKILEQGIPFNKTYFLDPGSLSNPSVQTELIDMTGFDMDLTGVSGDFWNTISGDIVVGSNETVSSFTVTNTDSIEYEITFQNLLPDYAKGYFGTYVLSDTTGFDLPFMNNVLAGSIDVDSIDMTIKVLNGFNLLAQAKITMLQGISSITGGTTNLSFPLLNSSMNINPANGGIYDWTYSEYPIVVNNSNSNIAPFIENLSDSIVLGYELMINPWGNITAGGDELFPGSTMDIVVEGEFPLNLGANNLTLTDTFDISYTGSGSYSGNSADVTLSYDNGFPLGASATLYLLNDQGTLIDSIVGDNGIVSGSYDSGTYLTATTSGTVNFNLTDINLLNLESTAKMAMLVSFSSDQAQMVKIDANAFFDFAVKSNLDIRLYL